MAASKRFDILYLSYKEVKHGAQKTFLSSSVFRPVRGLWYPVRVCSLARGCAEAASHSCPVGDP